MISIVRTLRFQATSHSSIRPCVQYIPFGNLPSAYKAAWWLFLRYSQERLQSVLCRLHAYHSGFKMLALSVTPILVLLLALSSSSAARHVDFLGRSNAAACETVTSTALVTIKLCDPATTTITSIQTVAAIPATVTVTVTGTPASGTWPVVKVTSTLSTASAATASCLSNAQATSIVEAFKTILTDPDRSVVNATAQALIADEFMETSDSINSLAGLPVSRADTSLTPLSSAILSTYPAHLPIYQSLF